MIRQLAIAAVFGGATVAGAALAQPADDGWRPSWNPDIPPSRATVDISADTTGSMLTSTNNPDLSMPAFDAQSGPRAAVLANHGYYVDHEVVVVHHRRYYDEAGRPYYYDEDGQPRYFDEDPE
ncbi:MAG TPA: hypothetical protein VG407_07855 [Caulobacteraceae bacterium]|jgi:hypothetical protein|nr:hypothetical protein [Caulobacteraceae bacterium]